MNFLFDYFEFTTGGRLTFNETKPFRSELTIHYTFEYSNRISKRVVANSNMVKGYLYPDRKKRFFFIFDVDKCNLTIYPIIEGKVSENGFKVDGVISLCD